MSRTACFFICLVLGLSSVNGRLPRRRGFLITLSHDSELTVYNANGEILARLANDLTDEGRVIRVKDLTDQSFSLILESLDSPCGNREARNDAVELQGVPAYTWGDREYLRPPSFSPRNFQNDRSMSPFNGDPRPRPIVKYLRDKLDETNQPTYESTVHLRGPWPVAVNPPENRLMNLKKRATTATDYHYKVNSFAGSSVA